MNKLFLIIILATSCNAVCSDEFKELRFDYYKGAKEFLEEIDNIIVNKYYIKKLDLNEVFDSRVENISILEAANRRLSIDSFEKYLVDYPNSDYIPDVLYRLGKLYFEEAAQKLILDTENYQDKYQLFVKGSIEVLPPEPTADYSMAVKHLNRLVKDYVEYRYRADALYLLAYSYLEEDQMSSSIKIFDKLINEYPESDKLAEVYTRIGEYYFDLDNFDKAMTYYNNVLKYPASPYYQNILYKLAWIHYHRGQYLKSSDYFVRLIDHSQKNMLAKESVSFTGEAKKYISMSFSELPDGVKSAYDFFNKIGGRTYDYEIMVGIINLYIQSERIKEAKDGVELILKYYPYNPDNPILQDKIVSSYRLAERIDMAEKERSFMIKNFGTGSKWRENNFNNPLAIAGADGLIEKQIISIAYYYQERGDRNKDKKEYVKSAGFYHDYLKSKPESVMSIGARFNYAQVLFNLENYKAAIIEYKSVLVAGDEYGYKQSAGLGLVKSIQNQLKTVDKKYNVKEIKPLSTDSMSELENELVLACDNYLKGNKPNSNTPYVMYIKAEVLFRNNKLNEAKDIYIEQINKYPGDEVTTDSIRNLISIYGYQEDHKQVSYWGNRLLSMKVLRDKKDINDIGVLVTGSVFRTAKQLEENGDFESSANEYLGLAKKFPKSDYADGALYNAGVIYEKLNRSNDAMAVYSSMIKKYPKSKHVDSAIFRLAINSERSLKLESAVYYYEQLISKYPRSEFLLDSQYGAYRIRRARSEYRQAAEHLMSYQKITKDQRDRSIAIMTSAWLYNKSGDKKRAVETYLFYVKSFPTDINGVLKAKILTADILNSEKKYKQAIAEYQWVVDYFNSVKDNKNSNLVDFYAEAKFKILNGLQTEYDSIGILNKDTTDLIKNKYNRKESMLKTLSEEYLKVIETRSSQWSVASIYMLGSLFHSFVDFFVKAPIPSELNTTELINEYNSQVKEQAEPYRVQALKYYERCIDESARLGLVNDWTKKARLAINELGIEQDYNVGRISETSYTPSIGTNDYGFMGI